MSARLYHEWKDAVVLIIADGSNSIVKSSGDITSLPYSETLTGFFIEEHYIVTNLSVISSPTIRTSDGSYYFASSTPYTNVNIQDAQNVINFYDLHVRVHNVNGSDCSFVYKPHVVGIDAARNIAVLRIDTLLPENQGYPPISDSHPYLSWGKSQDLCVGQTLYIIKDQNLNAQPYMKELKVIIPFTFTSTRTREYFGIDEILNPSYSGSPIIDCKGRVVGLITYLTSDDVVFTQHIIEYVVIAIITGIHGPLGCHLTQTTSNNLGYPINVYIQPLIGFAYQISKDGNSLVIKTDEYPTDLVVQQLKNGNLCSISYCGKKYCLGISKKHYHPIQIIYNAIVGDVVELNGIVNDVPYNICLELKAPTNPNSATLNSQVLLFVAHTATGINIVDRFPDNAPLTVYVNENILTASNYI